MTEVDRLRALEQRQAELEQRIAALARLVEATNVRLLRLTEHNAAYLTRVQQLLDLMNSVTEHYHPGEQTTLQ